MRQIAWGRWYQTAKQKNAKMMTTGSKDMKSTGPDPKTAACMIRPGTNVKAPATTMPPRYTLCMMRKIEPNCYGCQSRITIRML